jgi:hypothetical protein
VLREEQARKADGLFLMFLNIEALLEVFFFYK